MVQERFVPPSAPRPYVPNQLLSRLVGFRLFSVQFVMDYVQLRFDGPTEDMPVLNCDVLPSVEREGRIWRDGDVGYADSVRGLTSGTVLTTTEETGRGLRLEFTCGSSHFTLIMRDWSVPRSPSCPASATAVDVLAPRRGVVRGSSLTIFSCWGARCICRVAVHAASRTRRQPCPNISAEGRADLRLNGCARVDLTLG